MREKKKKKKKKRAKITEFLYLDFHCVAITVEDLI